MLNNLVFYTGWQSCVYFLHLCIQFLPMNFCHVTDNNINTLTSGAVL